jgi:hypothetical protein
LGRYYFIYAKSNGEFVSTALCSRTNWLFFAGPDLVAGLFGLDIEDRKFYIGAVATPVAASVLFLGLLLWRRKTVERNRAAQHAAAADR